MTKQKRIYTKYRVKVGHTTVHGGMTKNPPRRFGEHHNIWPTCHVIKVGRRVTKKSALQWEKDHGFQANN
jgi:hypothetical protein